MPLYDYHCEACGDFRAWRRMQAAQEAAECPHCGTDARRVLAAPQLGRVSRDTRRAHERNERSAHSPQLASARGLHRPATGSGCAHAHAAPGRGLLHGRPWMLGH